MSESSARKEYDVSAATRLNGICPYFTMFPLHFPLSTLDGHTTSTCKVMDPFCGRGTTLFAARLLGLESLGVDSSPVAVAIAASKTVGPNVDEVMAAAHEIIRAQYGYYIPEDDFWRTAYHPEVLDLLCRLREGLIRDCSTPARIALRAIILGALHGPLQKTVQSYFSNQCPRTYAPKPTYAINFWRSRGMEPPLVDVLEIIHRKAERYYGTEIKALGAVRLADSRLPETFPPTSTSESFSWVITSPPYYGMRTYIPDQWLRNWFVGGPTTVEYGCDSQLVHRSPREFAQDLRSVWTNIAKNCHSGARMVVRFGGISTRNASPVQIFQESLKGSGWLTTDIRSAGNATLGRRQANTFLSKGHPPVEEHDFSAIRD